MSSKFQGDVARPSPWVYEKVPQEPCHSSTSAFGVVDGPESVQPRWHGGVCVEIVTWGVALDVDDRSSRPGVDAAHPEGAAFAPQEARCTDAQWIWPTRSAGGEDPYLWQVQPAFRGKYARRASPLNPVQPDNYQEMAVFLDACQRRFPARQDIQCRVGPWIVELLGIWRLRPGPPDEADWLHAIPGCA